MNTEGDTLKWLHEDIVRLNSDNTTLDVRLWLKGLFR